MLATIKREQSPSQDGGGLDPRSELERAGDELIQKLTDATPEERTRQLAQMYVIIDRIGDAMENVIWALSRAQDAYDNGGELVGGNGACDCMLQVVPGRKRSCKWAVLYILGDEYEGNQESALPEKDPLLRRALNHAKTLEKVLKNRKSTLGKLQSNHQSCAKMLPGGMMGL